MHPSEDAQPEEEATSDGEEVGSDQVEQEEKPDPSQPNGYFVYLLESARGHTYVGATVNLDRRLRQHNRELVGGAKLTGKQVARGDRWRRVAHVRGFPSWPAALQFEWRWKQLTRKLSATQKRRLSSQRERRMAAVRTLLSLPRSTSKALPFAEWPAGPPELVLE